MIGIYAGRFQPFHKGHFEALRWIEEQCDEVYVCICSKKGESPLDDHNPFEYEERVEMIKRSLGAVIDEPNFRHIRDQESDAEWARVIENEMPEGEKVSFSNNPHTLSAFKEHGYETRNIPNLKWYEFCPRFVSYNFLPY